MKRVYQHFIRYYSLLGLVLLLGLWTRQDFLLDWGEFKKQSRGFRDRFKETYHPVLMASSQGDIFFNVSSNASSTQV